MKLTVRLAFPVKANIFATLRLVVELQTEGDSKDDKDMSHDV